jgi:glutathione S-transferase
MALIEKRLPFEIRWLDLGQMDQKRPGYRALNPSGLVPTLEHDGRVVFEANVIAEYLDDLWPNPRLVPADPWERIRMRLWLAFELECAKPFREAIYETYGRDRLQRSGVTAPELRARLAAQGIAPVYGRIASRLLETPRDPARVTDAVDILQERLAWMERELGDGRRWLLGEVFSLADLALATRVALLPLIGVHDLGSRFPAIEAFLGRVAARPSWAASDLMPGPDLSPTRVAPPSAS